MFKSMISRATALRKDEKGGVMIMFGLSLTVMSMVAGLAFDMSRTYASKSKVANAVDAAVLAAAKGIRLENMTDTQATEYAKRVFAENMRLTAGKWTNIDDVRVSIDRVTSKVTVEVDAWVEPTFGRLAGINQLGTSGKASAMFDARDFEIAVQLDVTGSMCSPCTKLDDLKDATKDLVDILIPSSPTAQKVRVAFAPFSAGVNVGPYIRDVNGDRASANTCVYERKTATNTLSDAVPRDDDAFKIKADLIPPAGRTVQDCPNAEIVPLTDKGQVLKDAVDLYRATGSTAGQLGAAWAWNLLSPKWKDIWPLASRPVEYNDGRTTKVAILMTDGVYNTIGGVNYGDTSPQAVTATNLSVELCTKMKVEGIKIYTVGFDLDAIRDVSARARAASALEACAGSTGRPHTPADPSFYKAENRDELRAAFNNIATDIMRLRLTN